MIITLLKKNDDLKECHFKRTNALNVDINFENWIG